MAWLGLLASPPQGAGVFTPAAESGVAEEHIARLHAPVGYNIGAETPHEIAVSVLAEILQIKNQAPGGLMMPYIRIVRNRKRWRPHDVNPSREPRGVRAIPQSGFPFAFYPFPGLAQHGD
ncbi:Uncharacterised protein [Raoultella terrigena]|uniref:XdhC Rossmann domain-containing protein n=1 Tax=Raoultella terrigena TaxID=577 RepID=A0A4U9CW29_RAOTE|nr:Uncharacterised protein [Raoultella terrigena]